jgi:hypothetical protein
VASGEQTVEMLQIQWTASSVEAIQISGLTIHGSGTGNEAVDVGLVFLADDSNGNGVFNAATDFVIAAAAYSSDDGAVSFIFSRTISGSGRDVEKRRGGAFRIGILQAREDRRILALEPDRHVRLPLDAPRDLPRDGEFRSAKSGNGA